MICRSHLSTDWLRETVALDLRRECQMALKFALDLLSFPSYVSACYGAQVGYVGRRFTVFSRGGGVEETHDRRCGGGIAQEDDGGGVVEGHS